MDKLLALSGQKKGTKVYAWKSKLYVMKIRRPPKSYLECRDKKKGCPALLRTDESSRSISLLKEHDAASCTVDEAAITILRAKNEMKQLAEETGAGTSKQSLRSVFKHVAEKHNVADRMAFGDVQNSMRKRWRLNMPTIPHSPEDALAAMAEVPPAYRKHFKHGINSCHGTALVFYGDKAQAAVAEGSVDFVQIDATFATCPRIFAQLLTLMVEYKGVMVPAAFSLMTNKSQNLYYSVLEEFKVGLGSNGSLQPSHGICDYEAAIDNAMTFHFPDMRMMGCAFHYSQSIYRKIVKVKLKPLYFRSECFREWARMLMGLPHLPPDQIVSTYKEGLEPRTFDCLYWEQAAVRKLKRYMNKHWIRKVRPDRLSVFGMKRRTNNEQESFHRWLRVQVPPVSVKANFWSFLGLFNDLVDEVKLDYQRLSKGLQIKRDRSKQRLEEESRLEGLQSLLKDGKLDPLEYLRAVKCKVSVSETEAAVDAEGDDDSDSSSDEEEGDEERANDHASSLCKTCWAAKVRVVVLPCGHAQLCTACAKGLKACPACGGAVAQVLEILL